MVRFSIFGIPVEVQPFFWITLVLIGGALGADSASAILQTLLFVLAGLISIGDISRWVAAHDHADAEGLKSYIAGGLG